MSRRRPLPWGAWLPAWVVGVVAGAWLGTLADRSVAHWAFLPFLLGTLLTPFCLLVHRRLGSVILAVSVGGGLLWGVALPEPPPQGLASELSSREVEGLVRAVRVGSWSWGRPWVRVDLQILDAGAARDGPRVGEGLLLSLSGDSWKWSVGETVSMRVRPRRARGFCNDGVDRRARNLRRRGIAWTARIRDDALIEETLGPGRRSWRALVAALREEVGQIIDRSADVQEAAILRALVIGDRSRISEELREVFARTGTAHLLAVSGMHLALVAAGVFGLVRHALAVLGGAGWRRPLSCLAAPAALGAAAAYALFSGGAVATVRALAMAGVLLGGVFLRRAPAPGRSLLFAVGVLVAADGEVLGDVSFQLSVTAVAAILGALAGLRGSRLGGLLSPGREANRRLRAGAWLLGTVVVSGAAGCATMPLGAYYFGLVSVVGVPTNLIVGPLLGMLALGLGLLGALSLTLSSWAGGLLFAAAGRVVAAALWVVQGVSGWELAALQVAPPSMGRTLGVLAVGGALLLPAGSRRYGLVAVGLGWVLLLGSGPANPWFNLSILDVGQGDATLLYSPAGQSWVVDGGGLAGGYDTGAAIVVPALEQREGGPLFAVVLSHAQRDHYGGLRSVVEAWRPQWFWWNGRGSSAQGFRALRRALEEVGTQSRVVGQGTAAFRDPAGLQITVLHPRAGEDAGLSMNDASLVLGVGYGAVRILLTGDIEARGEGILLRRYRSLPSTLIKVPHHGSRSSSRRELLEAVRPALAVASMGAFNRFGFPAAEVVSRYRALGSRWWDTAQKGEIDMVSDGQILRVSSCREADTRHPLSFVARLFGRN